MFESASRYTIERRISFNGIQYHSKLDHFSRRVVNACLRTAFSKYSLTASCSYHHRALERKRRSNQLFMRSTQRTCSQNVVPSLHKSLQEIGRASCRERV